MVVVTMVNGKQMKCMDMAFICGMMDVLMLVSTVMTRNVVMVSTPGLMVVVSMVGGQLASNMVLVPIWILIRAKLNMDSGNMVNVNAGLMKILSNRLIKGH